MSRALRAAVAGVAAVGVAKLTANGVGRRVDRAGFRTLNGAATPAADLAMKGITELGSIWAAAGAATVLAASGRRRAAVDAFGAAGAMWLVGQALKRRYARPRPYVDLPDVRVLIHRPRGTSWPSSHPAVLLAFVTVASRDVGAATGLRKLLAGLAGAVGLSRVYLGVHFPSDVAGGLLLGTGVAEAWTAFVSPLVADRLPDESAPVQ